MLHATAAPAQPKYVQLGGAHLIADWFGAASGAAAARTLVAMDVNLMRSSRMGLRSLRQAQGSTLHFSWGVSTAIFSCSDAQQLVEWGGLLKPLQGFLLTLLMPLHQAPWCLLRQPADALQLLMLQPSCWGTRRARCVSPCAPAARPSFLLLACAALHNACLPLDESPPPPRRSCGQGTT